MPPSSTTLLPPIPTLFEQKKAAILADLAVPDKDYTDQSPKGSVDDGIKDLIARINRIEGIVTTSSCAGRISVFLEGEKVKGLKQRGGHSETSEDAQADSERRDEDYEGETRVKQSAVPGGKGKGGRWLFVDHEPVRLPERDLPGHMPPLARFGLSNPLKNPKSFPNPQSRFVKFQFEPMVSRICS